MQIEIPDDLCKDFQRLVEARAFEMTLSEYVQRLIRREMGQYNLPDFADKDKLTGCHTPYQLEADLTHWLSYWVFHTSRTLHFMCYDISGFKKYNDTYGFGAGDQLLNKVANALREAYPGELIYRVGGDKFIVFLSDAESPKLQLPKGIALKHSQVKIVLPRERRWSREDGGAVRLCLYRGLSEARVGGMMLTYNGEQLHLAALRQI